MKIFYILIIILGAYCIFSIIRFRYILYTAHVPKFFQSGATMGKGPPLKYIASGDSTAVGEGASSAEHSYTYQIAQFLSQTNSVQYKNVGVSGAKTEDFANDQLSKIIEFNPDVVTISIGANDFTHFHNPDIVFANIESILKILTEQTHAQIYIADIPIIDRVTLLPYPYRRLLALRIKKTNPKILALETDRVHIVDIHEFGWDAYANISTTFAADGFHPNDVGYSNWTNAFLSEINRIN